MRMNVGAFSFHGFKKVRMAMVFSHKRLPASFPKSEQFFLAIRRRIRREFRSSSVLSWHRASIAANFDIATSIPRSLSLYFDIVERHNCTKKIPTAASNLKLVTSDEAAFPLFLSALHVENRLAVYFMIKGDISRRIMFLDGILWMG